MTELDPALRLELALFEGVTIETQIIHYGDDQCFEIFNIWIPSKRLREIVKHIVDKYHHSFFYISGVLDIVLEPRKFGVCISRDGWDHVCYATSITSVDTNSDTQSMCGQMLPFGVWKYQYLNII